MIQVVWDCGACLPPGCATANVPIFLGLGGGGHDPLPPGYAIALSGDRCVLCDIHLAEDDVKRIFRADAILVAKQTATTIGDDVIATYSVDEIVLL